MPLGQSDITSIELASGTAIATAADVTAQDHELVNLWLNGRGRHTQRAYRADSRRLFDYVKKPLRLVTLGDLQAFALNLEASTLAPPSQLRVLSSVKSLFAFGAKLGYLPFDVALPLRLPACRDTLADRILEEAEVLRLIAGAASPRNRLILQLLYIAGVRVSELVSLTWADCKPQRGAGQITVFGKGGKTRTIRLEAQIWTALMATRGTAAADAPVFVSRSRNGHLTTSQVGRVVKFAAAKAGLSDKVSPHWLRHCHASHTLDRGAPLSLVQQTLGHASIATTSRYLHARPNESSSRFLPPMG